MSNGFQPFSLKGRVAIVTGASGGIGRDIARVLAKAGVDLVLASRNLAALEEAAEEARQAGVRGLAVKCDVTDRTQVEAMVKKTLVEFGRVDVLVNNAGLGCTGDVETISEETWDDVIDVNLKGVFLCSLAVTPQMRRQKSGRIINIASVAGQTGGVAGGVNYSASKGGVIAFTKTLSRDLGPDGVTVNAIAPGQIDTGMGALPEEAKRRLIAQIPMRRLGAGDDIAYTVLFLASDEAGYITGATIDVNGGILKR